MEWQPIETAPKDGADFLAYDGFEAIIAYWNSYLRDYRDPHDGKIVGLTHWMPLPEPPK